MKKDVEMINNDENDNLIIQLGELEKKRDFLVKEREKEKEKVRKLKNEIFKGIRTEGESLENLLLNIDYYNKSIDEIDEKKSMITEQLLKNGLEVSIEETENSDSNKKSNKRGISKETKKSKEEELNLIYEEFEEFKKMGIVNSKTINAFKRKIEEKLKEYRLSSDVKKEIDLITREIQEKKSKVVSIEQELEAKKSYINKMKKLRKQEKDKVKAITDKAIEGIMTDTSQIENLSLNIDYFNKKIDELPSQKRKINIEIRKLEKKLILLTQTKIIEENKKEYDELATMLERVKSGEFSKNGKKRESKKKIEISKKEQDRREYIQKIKIELEKLRKQVEVKGNTEEEAKRKAEEEAKRKAEEEAERKAKEEARRIAVEEEELKRKAEEEKNKILFKRILNKVKQVALKIKNIFSPKQETESEKPVIKKEHISSENLWNVETMEKLRARVLFDLDRRDGIQKYEFDDTVEKIVKEETEFITHLYGSKDIPEEEKIFSLCSIFKKVYSISDSNSNYYRSNLSGIYDSKQCVGIFKDILKGNFDYKMKRNGANPSKEVRYLEKAINEGMRSVRDLVKRSNSKFKSILPGEYFPESDRMKIIEVLSNIDKKTKGIEEKKILEKIELYQLVYYFDNIDVKKAISDLSKMSLSEILKKISQGEYDNNKKQDDNPWAVSNYEWKAPPQPSNQKKEEKTRTIVDE